MEPTARRPFAAFVTIGLFFCAWVCPGMAATPGNVPLSHIPTDAPDAKTSYGQQIARNNYYDAYYDGFYGRFTDVYWGTDGRYWFLSQDGRTWRPDREGHFRRAPSSGFALVRGTGHQRNH